MIQLQRKRDKLAIVGFCSPHREWVPYEDEDLDVWGLNRGYIFQQRADMWWDMHSPHIIESQQRRPGNHVRFLMKFPGPVILQERFTWIPNSVEYPFELVAEDIGRNIYRFAPPNADPRLGTDRPQSQVPYLASTIAQQIALAISMGYREVALYGIDLNTSSEYAWQKPGVEHLLGVAAGRGIKIGVPDMCPLMLGNIYGRGYKRPEGEHMTLPQFKERLDALVNERDQYLRELNRLEGGKAELEQSQAQMIPGMDHELQDRRRQDYERAIMNKTAQCMRVDGQLNETLYWSHITPDGQPPDEALRELRLARMAETGQAEGPDEGSNEALLADAPSSGDRPYMALAEASPNGTPEAVPV